MTDTKFPQRHVCVWCGKTMPQSSMAVARTPDGKHGLVCNLHLTMRAVEKQKGTGKR